MVVEWADRVKLFRAPLHDSWQRAIHLPRATYGMSIAHFGLAVSVAGFSASAFAVDSIQALKVGQSLQRRRLHHDAGQRAAACRAPNFTAQDADIAHHP